MTSWYVRCLDIQHLPAIKLVKGQDAALQFLFTERYARKGGFNTFSGIKTCALCPEWNCFSYLDSCYIFTFCHSLVLSYWLLWEQTDLFKSLFPIQIFALKGTIYTWRCERALSQVFDVSIQTFCLSLWAMLQWVEDFSFARSTPLSTDLVIVKILFATENFSSLKINSSETIWQLSPTQLDRKERRSPLYLIC